MTRTTTTSIRAVDEERRVHLHVDGHPDITVPSLLHKTEDFTPGDVRIKYTRSAFVASNPWRLEYICVTDRVPEGYNSVFYAKWWPTTIAEAPEWVQALVKEHTP